MKLFQYPKKDTYITNKIINNTFRAIEANVGLASTIDIFKLSDVNVLKTESAPYIELSRGLLQFDLQELESNITKYCSLDDESLSIKLIMKNLNASQSVIENLTLDLCEVTTDWSEGVGTNIYEFSDKGAASWVSASNSTEWISAGGDYKPVIIASQLFEKGTEDLEIDITSYCLDEIASGSYGGSGFMLKIDNIGEASDQNLFVKRFSSSNAKDYFLKPKLEISFNNHFVQNRQNFYTGLENVIAIENYGRDGRRADLIEEPKCVLSYGTWSKSGSVGQVNIGGYNQLGWYQATFDPIDIYTTDIDLKADLEANMEIELTETWTVNSEQTVVYTGTQKLILKLAGTSNGPQDWRFTPFDVRKEYPYDELVRIRIFARDKKRVNEPVRTQIQLPSLIVPECYYQIREESSKRIVIPWSYGTDNSTRVSNDGQGMYFEFQSSSLAKGLTYTVELLYIENGQIKTDNLNVAFKVK